MYFLLFALITNTAFCASSLKMCRCAQLIKHHAMKTWGSGGVAPPYLTWALMEVCGQLNSSAHLHPVLIGQEEA
jgi:hypothetical protein